MNSLTLAIISVVHGHDSIVVALWVSSGINQSGAVIIIYYLYTTTKSPVAKSIIYTTS